MAALISRAAAIEAFDDERVDRNYGDVSPESVIGVIESIPAVDAAPVVRCKDCSHRGSNAICVKLWVGTKDSFFCAFGERR